MGKIPYWDANPQLWDTIKVGGVLLPGLVVVTGGIGRKVDVQQVDGSTTGGTQTVLGYEGAKVTITLSMWTQAHLDAYMAFVAKFRPQKNETDPKAIDVIHPALAAVGIQAVTLERLGIPEKSQVTGIYTAELQMLEFISETKAGTGGTFTIDGSTEITSQEIAGADALAGGQNNTPATTPPPAPAIPTPPVPFGPVVPKPPALSTPYPAVGGPGAGLTLPDPLAPFRPKP